MAHAPVVVGLDVSAAAMPTLQWAVTEAQRRGSDIVVAHAPDGSDADIARSVLPDGNTEVVARVVTAMYTAVAARTAPEAPIRSVLLDGPPVESLVALSRDASLVVLGSRGRADFADSALGSVGHRIAAHAHCPVVIVPATSRHSTGGVVVAGFARETAGGNAVAVAADIAAGAGRELVLVHSTVPSDVDETEACLHQQLPGCPGRPTPSGRVELTKRRFSWRSQPFQSVPQLDRATRIADRARVRPAAGRRAIRNAAQGAVASTVPHLRRRPRSGDARAPPTR